MHHSPCPQTASADASYQGGRWKESIQAYKALTQSEPDLLEAWLGLAQAQAALGQYQWVLESLLKAADICHRTQRLEMGLKVLQRILDIEPSHEEALHRRVDLLFTHGQLEQAIAFSREFAQHQLESDQGEAAIALLVRCFQLKPDDLDLSQVLAEAYLAQGQMREAAGMFRQLVPRLVALQELDKAANLYKRLSLIEPKNEQHFFEAGQLYLQLEKLSEADQQFRAVLRLDLNHRQALLKVAQVGILRQQFRDASTAYNKLITLNSDDAEAQEGLGMVYRHQGMQQEAAKHLLLAGLAFADKEVLPRALACFKAVLEIDPSNSIAGRQLKLLAPGVS